MPNASTKLVLGLSLGLLIVGATVLIAVRGPAMLLDLSALAGMICF